MSRVVTNQLISV